MKCFEKLVRCHIKSCLPATLDPFQLAYRANRSTEDAIATALHATISHLEHPGHYARLLFIDFSSAFNTILRDRLTENYWTLDFLSPPAAGSGTFYQCVQRVRVGPHLSTALSLSTGSPQGFVLSPLLYTLYTYDCVSTHPSNIVIKFADDTNVVGLISEGDETPYRTEIQRLVGWCAENNLVTSKTKKLIVDYRRRKPVLQSIYINGEVVERVSSYK